MGGVGWGVGEVVKKSPLGPGIERVGTKANPGTKKNGRNPLDKNSPRSAFHEDHFIERKKIGK